MKQLKYEIPGLLLTLSLLFISNEIDENVIKYGVITIAVIGVVVLAYLITKVITEYISTLTNNSETNIEKLSLELLTTIEKYSIEQNNNSNQIMEIIEKFYETTNQYMEKVSALTTIQNSIIEEEKTLTKEVKSMSIDIHKLIEGFSKKIDNSLSETISSIRSFHQIEEELFRDTIERIDKQNGIHEDSLEKIITTGLDNINKNIVDVCKSTEDTLAAFCSDFSEIQKQANENQIENISALKANIEAYMNRYETVLNETKDSLNALKSQVKVSLDQANKAIQNQTNCIEDGLDDCVEEIGTKLKEFGNDQKNRDNEQNTKLNDEIKEIGKVVSNQIGQVLEANDNLLVYIQKVQNDWTSLSKDEIAFLEKVWNE